MALVSPLTFEDIYEGRKLRCRTSFNKPSVLQIIEDRKTHAQKKASDGKVVLSPNSIPWGCDYIKIWKTELMQTLKKDYDENTVHLSMPINKFKIPKSLDHPSSNEAELEKKKRSLLVTEKSIYILNETGYIVEKKFACWLMVANVISSIGLNRLPI